MTDPTSAMPSTIDRLKDFVEGHTEVQAFEDVLYRDPDVELHLSAAPAPRYAASGHTLYHYLISLNYGSPLDVLNARTALGEYLAAHGIAFDASGDEADMAGLIIAAEPQWLRLDPIHVQAVLEGAPTTLSRAELKKWLRRRILELFRYAKKPPRWLQAPAWPVGDNGPLVFLGQVAIPDYFHDEAAAYVFHDPVTMQCQTVLQTC